MKFDVNTFLELVGIASSFASIISLVIGIITVKNTARIKDGLLRQVEANSFMGSVEEYIQNLQSYHDTIVDEKLYNESVLLRIVETLDELQISYSLVFSKELLSDITKMNSIYTECTNDIQNNEKKNEYLRALNVIITRLKKLKTEKEGLR